MINGGGGGGMRGCVRGGYGGVIREGLLSD